VYIQQVRLTNFRNFANAVVNFTQQRNLILGRNAQGKTNLLEAIHILAVGRSHRERREANLIRFGEKFYRIEGVFHHIGVRNVVEITYAEQRKRIRINGKEVRPIDLIGFIGIVISSPEDIALVKGSPGIRRLFLDMALCQMRRDYLRSLQRYLRVVEQRNQLLKRAQSTGRLPSEMSVWNAKLIEIGTAVVRARLRYLAEIQDRVEANFRAISGTPQLVQLAYSPRGYRIDNEVDIGDAIGEALESVLDAETMRGYTLVGPHLDDFVFNVDGRDLRLFGSEGEQRTAVLALRCAEAQAMKAVTGRMPIVLLDDVFAELDEERATALRALISDFDQIILTSSRAVGVDKEDINVIEVAGGRIVSG